MGCFVVVFLQARNDKIQIIDSYPVEFIVCLCFFFLVLGFNPYASSDCILCPSSAFTPYPE